MASASSFMSCMVVFLLSAGVLLLSGEASADCKVDVGGLVSKCGKFVTVPGPKTPPSADCCGVVKATDIACACNLMGSVPGSVSLDKVCFVAKTCGNPLTPGSKCGSWTVPSTC